MREDQEILIMKYLDREASDQEKKEAEIQLDQNVEAKKLLESLKRVSIQLENKYQSPAVFSAEKRLKDILITQERNILSSVWSLFSLNNLAVASFSVLMTVMIARPFLETGVIFFEEGVYEKTILVSTTEPQIRTRGLSMNYEPEKLVEADYNELVQQLILSNKQRAIFEYNGVVFDAKIEEAYLRNNKKFYYGHLNDLSGKKKNFFAVEGDEMDIFFTN